jgi:hypothetical protein
MKIDAFKSVQITNTYVVDFLSLHSKNEVLIKACDDVLHNFCKLASEFMNTHAKEENNKREGSAMLELIRQMDKNIDDKLSILSNTVADRVTCQISGLMTVISQTVERLDVTTISNTLNDSMKRWLNDTMKDANEEIKTLMEKQLNDVLIKNVLETVKDMKDKLTDQLTQIPSQMKESIDGSEIISKVKGISVDMDSFIESIKSNANNIEQNMLTQLKAYEKIANIQGDSFTKELQTLPIITKGIISDVLKQLELDSNLSSNKLTTTLDHLRRIEHELRDHKCNFSAMNDKVEAIDKKLIIKTTSNSAKGTDGEDQMYEMLSDRLLARDGYIVESIRGQSQSCDILVKREKYPSIRIEVKAHGKGTKEKIRYKEVEKFQRDLLHVNDHGIFVSLYNGIVGISNFEIQQLSNGKFAVYLANNNYDIDVILDIIQLLYRLDTIVNQNKDGAEDNHMRISVEALTRIKSYLKDYNNKLTSVKTHMKESITLLSEIQMDLIENVLMGQCDKKKEEKHSCDWCKETYVSKSVLNRHKKTCKQKPCTGQL